MMRSDELGFWAWLLLPSSTLIDLGVPAADVVACRHEVTGHLRPAPLAWAAAYFLWGGVETSAEIATRTEHTRDQVRQYAKDARLRFATPSRRFTHAELAIALWCDRASTPSASCARFGVPPGARRILCSAMQVVIDAAPGGVKEVLSWRLPKLELAFSSLRLELEPPRSVLAAARSATEAPRSAA